jgi:hypothetical protein
MNYRPTIGLFGTCGDSEWRRPFMVHYNGYGIDYFNPKVKDWKPELAAVEAEHLRTDEIILFPVTDETYGSGSLAEVGFSILQAVTDLNEGRFVIVMISPEPCEALKADAVAFKESVRARTLVKAHLAANPHPNVYIVDTFEQMLALSVGLYRIASFYTQAAMAAAKRDEERRILDHRWRAA